MFGDRKISVLNFGIVETARERAAYIPDPSAHAEGYTEAVQLLV